MVRQSDHHAHARHGLFLLDRHGRLGLFLCLHPVVRTQRLRSD
jgi:hypothetical protein